MLFHFIIPQQLLCHYFLLPAMHQSLQLLDVNYTQLPIYLEIWDFSGIKYASFLLPENCVFYWRLTVSVEGMSQLCFQRQTSPEKCRAQYHQENWFGAAHHEQSASTTGGIKSVPSDAQGFMGLVEIAFPSVEIKLCVMLTGQTSEFVPAAPLKKG